MIEFLSLLIGAGLSLLILHLITGLDKVYKRIKLHGFIIYDFLYLLNTFFIVTLVYLTLTLI